MILKDPFVVGILHPTDTLRYVVERRADCGRVGGRETARQESVLMLPPTYGRAVSGAGSLYCQLAAILLRGLGFHLVVVC